MRKIAFLALFLSLFSCTEPKELVLGSEQPGPHIEVHKSAAEVLPGNTITLEYILVDIPLAQVYLSELPLFPQGLEWVEGDWTEEGYYIQLRSLVAGDYRVPPLSFEGGGSWTSPPVDIHYPSALDQENLSLRPQRMDYPIGVLRAWQWVLLAILSLVILIILLFGLRKKATPPKPLYIYLEQKMKKDFLPFPSDVSVESYYKNWSYLLRHFAHRIWNLPMEEQTLEEYAPSFFKLPIVRKDQEEQWQEILMRMDYAKYFPTVIKEETMEEDQKAIRKVLEAMIQTQREKDQYGMG